MLTRIKPWIGVWYLSKSFQLAWFSCRPVWLSSSILSRFSNWCRPHRRSAGRHGNDRSGLTRDTCYTTTRPWISRHSLLYRCRCHGLWCWSAVHGVHSTNHLRYLRKKEESNPCHWKLPTLFLEMQWILIVSFTSYPPRKDQKESTLTPYTPHAVGSHLFVYFTINPPWSWFLLFLATCRPNITPYCIAE